ncbi:hypothetical protein BC832DRAFT_604332 [Gaertneriomyces semiglobifer]|nr:hypothetical protein BC832DRAFT_604332 [Gaertneriomyces semiglobifer]
MANRAENMPDAQQPIPQQPLPNRFGDMNVACTHVNALMNCMDKYSSTSSMYHREKLLPPHSFYNEFEMELTSQLSNLRNLDSYLGELAKPLADKLMLEFLFKAVHRCIKNWNGFNYKVVFPQERHEFLFPALLTFDVELRAQMIMLREIITRIEKTEMTGECLRKTTEQNEITTQHLYLTSVIQPEQTEQTEQTYVTQPEQTEQTCVTQPEQTVATAVTQPDATAVIQPKQTEVTARPTIVSLSDHNEGSAKCLRTTTEAGTRVKRPRKTTSDKFENRAIKLAKILLTGKKHLKSAKPVGSFEPDLKSITSTELNLITCMKLESYALKAIKRHLTAGRDMKRYLLHTWYYTAVALPRKTDGR